MRSLRFYGTIGTNCTMSRVLQASELDHHESPGVPYASTSTPPCFRCAASPKPTTLNHESIFLSKRHARTYSTNAQLSISTKMKQTENTKRTAAQTKPNTQANKQSVSSRPATRPRAAPAPRGAYGRLDLIRSNRLVDLAAYRLCRGLRPPSPE